MQTQRGFVSATVFIAIALGLIVVVGGAYYVVQQNSPSPTLSDNNSDNTQALSTGNNQQNSQQPSNQSPTNTTSDVRGSQIKIKQISFVVPDGWTTEYRKGSHEAEAYILRSPDYEKPKPGCGVGDNCDLPANGAEISVVTGFSTSSYYSSEERMREWVEDYRKNCSNCTSGKLIEIDGTPALFKTNYTDDVMGSGEGANAGCSVNGVQYYIAINSPKPYNENQALFEAFLRQVRID